MCKLDFALIASLLSIIIEVAAIVFAIIQFISFKKQNYKDRIKDLNELVVAFQCEEEIMSEEIAKLRNNGKAAVTVRKEFRDFAENHPKNINHIRPKK